MKTIDEKRVHDDLDAARGVFLWMAVSAVIVLAVGILWML